MGCCVSTSSRGGGGKKRTKRTFSDHVSAFQHTSSIPNRIFANGKSRSSCIFTQQGRKGINQDAMIVWEDFMSEDVTFCGVFDGHGPHGHLVARKVRDTLPLKLFSFLDSYESKKNQSSTSICCNGDPGLEEADREEEKPELLWREAFLKSYKAMDKELKSHPNLDCFCSGSTAVTIVKQGSNLFMGSIGDSRAIMASKDVNDSLVAIQLTVDLKPDLPREAERIKRCKGRVFALQDEPEVPRVWLPFDDAPGLAMARAFGDFCLKEYGVISIPEVSHRILTENDKFIVLASDGIWDVLSNEQVIETVSSAPTRSSAARILVDLAAREWKTKYPTSKMDDCAVVCLFLDGKMDAESDNEDHGFSSATLQSNAGESDDGQNPEPYLQRNFTVRSSEETNDARKREQNDVVLEGKEETVIAVTEDQNWSGLEGVTRVNSLVQLPRFSEEQPRT
ncbi:probable protein phosphatase 2C 52 [Cynara cardunculus var. scolymus]|uniref:probable protein phosphatase 2C 52 n=1 Tax=Cynara cardunculus var. scolymus TaxID=59895 RepID=UPI000D623048|nr:probable protein phosphatase 2C 52 [Cynara cardunculus var. scolymus]XP_024991576.1 probable protein phosphatase 2C 52 [Cynara cardunculus var. scolymus]XP_024991577.1 probable protein phosphatase 2C 52 [Cynara cardunculus var. scolymus]XP_024991579.1 probable protein phosphatase 2C 52 [Cynara cardunculus var. scolymus]XP_024991580.1 probable protein phosphatase 2C 52 [Cynara cardunculus var. scolymus]XP_024991581.1 probable protein phosphatase 2C 52 [Cynara cardunculus var. scolymus]